MYTVLLDAAPHTDALSSVLAAPAHAPEVDRVRDGDFWRPAFDSLPDSLAVLDATGEIVAVNRAWRSFSQANGGGARCERGNYLDVCDSAAAAEPTGANVARGLREIAAGLRDDYACVYACDAPEQQRWFTLSAALLPASGARHILVAHRDITVRRQAQLRSREQGELLDAVGAAITMTDLDGRVTHWSAGAETLFGRPAAEVIGRAMAAVADAHGELDPADDRPAAGERCEWERRLEVRHPDGRRLLVEMRNRLLFDADGAPSGVIGVSLDITKRVALERQLRGARDFRDAVLQTMPDGLYVLDELGRVTLVNETAERLLGWTRRELLGVVLHEKLQAVTADGGARPVAQRLDACALAAGGTMRVVDDVLQRRDGSFLPVAYSAAPFTSESDERGCVVVIKDITERRARELELHRELEETTWVNRIHEALEHDRFVLYAQPIVDLATGRTIQHELLLRMIGAEGEVIAPGEFLPAAERHGLIRAIDRRVFEMALGHAADGHAVEINLSADTVGDPTLFAFVQDAIEAHGVDPRLIVFEITETALIHNEAAAQTFTEAVVELGCQVALDDFGTGYGTFHYLKHLPVTLLKIDREFVLDLAGEGSAASRLVISAIVTLARGMGMTTVAEGVETEAVLRVIRDLGVDTAQGYLFARPAPADGIFTASLS